MFVCRTPFLIATLILFATFYQVHAELVAHWKLNEGSGSTFADSAGNNDGFLIQAGNVEWWTEDSAPTEFANPYAMTFDRANQQFVQTTYEGIEFDNPRTISAWIRTNSTSSQAIVAYGARDGNGRKWHFRVNPDGGGRVPGAIRTEAQGGNQTGDTNIADGQWHHVVSVFDGVDNIDVMHYVDGELEGETGTTDELIDTGIGDPFPLVSIGARQQSPPNYDSYMLGQLDDIRIYNRALTEAEIQTLGSNPTTNGLVAHWPFDDGPDSQIATDVIDGNNGDLITNVNDAEIEWITDGPPVQSTAVEFSGDNSWIQTEFEGIGGNDPRTITFWMRTDDDQSTHGIVGYGNSQSMQKFHIRVNNNAGNGEVGAIRTEVEGGQNVASTYIADGDWHHIAVVFPEDGEMNSDVMHYVDGELELQSGGGDQIVDTLIGEGAEPVTLGMRVQGANRNFFPGALADVRIYDEALDLASIQAIMNGEGLESILGDFNSNGELDVEDVDLLSADILSGNNTGRFDLTKDDVVDNSDLRSWVKDARKTWYGDANLDGEFNSSDFVLVFQNGKFETGLPASWGDGDWNADGVFDTSDFVVAFQDGGFEQGPLVQVNNVPEPQGFVLLLLISAAWNRRRF